MNEKPIVEREIVDEGQIKFVYQYISKDAFYANYKNFTVDSFIKENSKHNKSKLISKENQERILSFTYQVFVNHHVDFNLNEFIKTDGANIETILENKFNISSLDIMSETYLNNIADNKYANKELEHPRLSDDLTHIIEGLVSINNIESEKGTYLLICWHIVPASKPKSKPVDIPSKKISRIIREASLIYTYQFLLAREHYTNLDKVNESALKIKDNAHVLKDSFSNLESDSSKFKETLEANGTLTKDLQKNAHALFIDPLQINTNNENITNLMRMVCDSNYVPIDKKELVKKLQQLAKVSSILNEKANALIESQAKPKKEIQGVVEWMNKCIDTYNNQFKNDPFIKQKASYLGKNISTIEFNLTKILFPDGRYEYDKEKLDSICRTLTHVTEEMFIDAKEATTEADTKENIEAIANDFELVKEKNLKEVQSHIDSMIEQSQEIINATNEPFSFDSFVMENSRNIEEILEKRFNLSSKELIDNPLFEGIMKGLFDCDNIIKYFDTKITGKWTFDRLGKMEQAILINAYIEINDELTKQVSSDKKAKQVVINEAVELAKKYGEEDSYKLINGVLDNIDG